MLAGYASALACRLAGLFFVKTRYTLTLPLSIHMSVIVIMSSSIARQPWFTVA
ncbi:MAG: hypothetical protein ACREV1_07905 [Gammaproteobacteria bacterium]